MTWFKVDDGLTDHPKIVALQEQKGWHRALALWTLAGAWCSKQLTNGKVPTAMVARLGCTKQDADLLVQVGLWVAEGNGYAFHDWTRCNPTKEAIEAKREKTRAKVTDWRRNQVTSAVTDHEGNPPSNPAPLPTSPDLSRPGHTPLPPPGSAHEFEVKQAWQTAWADAKAGRAPALTSGLRDAAIEFARGVAQDHGKTLYEAAYDIAKHVLKHSKGGKEIPFDLARMDPYAAARPSAPTPPRQIVFPVGLP